MTKHFTILKQRNNEKIKTRIFKINKKIKLINSEIQTFKNLFKKQKKI